MNVTGLIKRFCLGIFLMLKTDNFSRECFQKKLDNFFAVDVNTCPAFLSQGFTVKKLRSKNKIIIKIIKNQLSRGEICVANFNWSYCIECA